MKNNKKMYINSLNLNYQKIVIYFIIIKIKDSIRLKNLVKLLKHKMLKETLDFKENQILMHSYS